MVISKIRNVISGALLFMTMYIYEYRLVLTLVTWPNIIIQRAVNWGIELYYTHK